MDYKKLPLLLSFILPVSAFILPASAQEKAVGTRTIRFLFPNGAQDAPFIVHLHDGLSSQVVELPRMNLSEPYEVPAGLLKLRLLPEPVEQPELVPPDAPEVVIPEETGDAYLLCVSDPGNPVLPLRMKVVDAGKDKFRDGQMMWFNLTPFAVAGTLGKEKVRLRPQGRAIIDGPAAAQDGYPVSISYMIKGDQRVHPICETRWVHDPQSRQLVFVFTEADRRLPRIMGFADFRPPPPPEPPANDP